MRTAQVLKFFAYGVIVAGTFFASRLFSPASLEFWGVIFFCCLFWLILRIFAIIGQLVFEMRNESARMLASIERGLYYSNALTKEIRDMVDWDPSDRKSHENTSS